MRRRRTVGDEYDIETYAPSGGLGASAIPAVKVSDPYSGCYAVCQLYADPIRNEAAAVRALDAMLRLGRRGSMKPSDVLAAWGAFWDALAYELQKRGL
jgi:hypothetical protein